MTAARRLAFAVNLRHPVLGVTRRRGWLLEGAAGWGEWSPLPSWSRAEAVTAFRGAAEAADHPFPAPVHDEIDINAMIPRIDPGTAARLAVESGCSTLKVKVGDVDGVARVGAVREAVGRSARIRLDANGSWDAETAASELRHLARFDIELAEDPVAGMEELALLRRSSQIPLAAEMCVRTVEDVKRLCRLDAADALVLKPQRIGGIAAALRAAEAARVPVIISSALETSVGLAAVLAVAAAIPAAPFAHGIGTALLLAADVTASPLLPRNGRLRPGRVAPDLLLAQVAATG